VKRVFQRGVTQRRDPSGKGEGIVKYHIMEFIPTLCKCRHQRFGNRAATLHKYVVAAFNQLDGLVGCHIFILCRHSVDFRLVDIFHGFLAINDNVKIGNFFAANLPVMII
jgi:hypothetical protein